MKTLVMAMAGAGLMVAGGAGGWFLMGGEIGVSSANPVAEGELWAREREFHEVSLFSYVYPATGAAERQSVAVMLTVGVKGRSGLGGVCNAMPLLREAVLRVFNDAAPDLHRKTPQGQLDRLSKPLRRALNGVVPGNPVQTVDARVLMDAGIGGAASFQTDRTCREFVSS
jgi:hypothetical protein